MDMASMTVSGLGGSGLDVNSIVSQLMAIEQQPIDKVTTKEATYTAKLTAYGTLKGGLSALQTATTSLTNAARFQTTKATPSDSTALSATASSTAAIGTYSIDIGKLAQAQLLAAAGQLNTTDTIGTGTLNFDLGTISNGTLDSKTGKYTGASFTSNNSGTRAVTIDSTNDSLGGIRDAINSANIGVTASIVNDGNASPYRLVLSSSNSGVANSLKISVTGNQALSDLMSHDPANDTGQNLSETITAQNAQITVNGIAASKSSNVVTDVINGVTLNLLNQTTSTKSVSVARDAGTVQTSLQAFVTAYNDIAKSLHDLSAYDASTQSAAVLQGDFTPSMIKSQLQNAISASNSNITSSVRTLSQIGVSFQRDGSLSIDTAKLQSAVDSNPGDVAALVAAAGGSLGKLLDSQLNSSNGQIAGKRTASILKSRCWILGRPT
jgi:flagellar hook-associated protein 2